MDRPASPLAILFLAHCLAIHPTGAALARSSSSSDQAKVIASHLPILFEKNSGQDTQAYAYVAHDGGLRVRFARDHVSLLAPGLNSTGSDVTMRFVKANSNASLESVDLQNTEVNYLTGSDRSLWHTHVQTFREVRYKDLYPGVDLTFYGNGRDLEHDFTLAPGTDPHSIALEFEGMEHISVDRSGELIISTGNGQIRLKQPIAYQLTASGKRFVEARFDLNGRRVSFAANSYDRRLPLVIDPVLVYSTYLAGSNSFYAQGNGSDMVAGLAVDGSGNVYVAGMTNSVDFPVQGGYNCGACKTSFDLFITKLDPTGSSLIYSTYIGGSRTDQPVGIGVDASGNVLVGGITDSFDFPLVNSYTTSSLGNNQYAFALSLSASGSQLNYSSLIGFIQYSSTMAFAIDAAGNSYLSGLTGDPAFPITQGTIGSSISSSSTNLFLTKLSQNGALSYSTVVSQSSYFQNFTPWALAVDASGSTYIGGAAGPGLATTPGTISPIFPGNPQGVGFLLKVNQTASSLVFGTYLPNTDFVRAVVPRGSGVFVGGVTSSPQFPATPGAFQTTMRAGKNCTCSASFVADVDGAGTAYSYATFLAGTPADSNVGSYIVGLSLDPAGNIWASGATGSSDFPLQLPVSPNFPVGGHMADFLVEMKPDLSALLFSSFLSGWSGLNHMTQLFVSAGPNGTAFVAGNTDDPDFPTTPGSFEPALPSKAWPYNVVHTVVAKIDSTIPNAAPLYSPLLLDLGQVTIGSTTVGSITITNAGNADLDFLSASFSTTELSQTNTCSSPVVPGGTCRVDVKFTPTTNSGAPKPMTITTNGAVANQTILFNAQTLPGFYFALAGNGSTTQTVTSGQTAAFALSLNSVQYGGGTVRINCLGLPQYASCGVSPNSISPGPNAQVPVSVTVSTAQSGSAEGNWRWSRSYGVFAIALVLAPLSLRSRHVPMCSRARFCLFLVLLVSLYPLIACGGGSSGGSASHTVAPGTYIVRIGATDGQVATTMMLTLVVR